MILIHGCFAPLSDFVLMPSKSARTRHSHIMTLTFVPQNQMWFTVYKGKVCFRNCHAENNNNKFFLSASTGTRYANRLKHTNVINFPFPNDKILWKIVIHFRKKWASHYKKRRKKCIYTQLT